MNGINHINDGGVFKELRDTLLEAIRAGLQQKKVVYAKGAEECQRFILGQHEYLFDAKFITEQMYMQIGSTAKDDKPARAPRFKISDNWVAKYMQIVTPYLTQGQVVRTVKPTKPYVPPPGAYGIDPPEVQMLKLRDKAFLQANPQYVMQQSALMSQANMEAMGIQSEMVLRGARSDILTRVLNYTISELGLMKERRAIVEDAIAYGFAAYMTELVQMPISGTYLVGSRHIGANDIVWDPDAMTEKDCKWLAIQCRAPKWQFSKLYNVPEERIKANSQSTTSERFHKQLLVSSGGQDNVNHRVPPKDEVVYWKFWSRMGSGARLKDLQYRNATVDMLDGMLGDYCFFILTDAVDYPVNLTPELLEQAAQQMPEIMAQNQQLQAMGQEPIDPFAMVSQACAWPTPFYLDVDDPWPITTLSFHRRNGSPYPIPHFEFALSYLKFMVWVVSFVADKCYRSQRDIWIIDSQISEQLKTAIEEGDDECIVKLKDMDQKTIKQFVDIISAPELKTSLMEVYQFFEQKVEQMTGLNDLMQAAMARSMRTATEAQVVSDASQLRPKDMAQRVNETDTRVSRKESITALLHYQEEDIAAIVGIAGASAWKRLTAGQSVINLMRESDHEVIASQGRILDLDTRKEQSNKLSQLVLPMLVQLGQVTGIFGPANRVLREIAEANQIDPELMMFPDMPPPAPATGVASAPKESGSRGPQP